MVKFHFKAMRNQPGKLLGLWALPGIVQLITKLLLGLTDDQEAALNAGHNFLYRYFNPMLPFRGADGLPIRLNGLWLYPLFGDFRVATGPGGIGIPLVMSQPPVVAASEMMFNRDLRSGKAIINENDTVAMVAFKEASHFLLKTAPAPPMIGTDALRLYRAATGESGESVNVLIGNIFFGLPISKPGMSRRAVFDLVKERLGDKEAESARAIVDYYNEIGKKRYNPKTGKVGQKPIYMDSVRESMQHDRERALEAAR
jgi:hypothetical protein